MATAELNVEKAERARQLCQEQYDILLKQHVCSCISISTVRLSSSPPFATRRIHLLSMLTLLSLIIL